MTLRALHVIATYSPKGGGPQAALWPMLNAIAKHGIDVSVAATDSDGPDGTMTRERLPKTSATVHMLNGNAALSDWLNSNTKNYDVIHTHGLWNRPASVGMSSARASGKPYVVRTCGMLAPYSWNRRWWKKRPYWWFVERANVRNAAAIHVTSPGERDEVAAWKLPPPIHEIPLGLDEAAFETPHVTDDLKRRCEAVLNRPIGDEPILLTLGRLHPVKGLADLLVPAFAKIRTPAVLAIAGGPDETVPNYPDEIRKAIETHGLQNRVALLGNIPPKEKWALYDGATLYVQPSKTENFGLSVAEALARACPVVVTEGVQSRSVVETVKGGWVVAYNVERLAHVFGTALSNRPECAAIGRHAREAVRNELSWDRTGAKLAELYHTVTAKKTR